MAIKDRNVKPGDKLVAKYHKQTYICEVVAVDGDKVRANMPDGKVLLIEGQYNKVHYRLEDGREFKSPSGAGMAVTGHACDGWNFWSPATATETAATEAPTETVVAPAAETSNQETDAQAEKETPAEATPATEEPGPAKKRIFRLPNQKGVPEGKVRWYCHDCGKSFLTAPGDNPQTCPEGHKVS